MSMKRWVGLALVLTVAFAGCKKKEETPPPALTPQVQTPAPGQPATPPVTPAATPTPVANPTPDQPPVANAPTAAAAAESEAVLRALDGSADKLSEGFGSGLAGAFAGLGQAKRSGSETPEPGEPTEGTEEPSPVQRVQMHVDLAGLRASPLGPLVASAMQMAAQSGDIKPNQTCLLGLLGKINTGFADVTLGPDGEPSGVLLSIKSTATKEEVLDCMKGMADEGHRFVELPVGDRTGYTMKEGDEPVEAVLVETTPGNWLFGMQANVEAGLVADPEAEAGFQSLVGPLGPSFARMTILFKPDFFAQLAGELAADAPPQVQCLRNAATRVKGTSVGIRLTPDFALSVAIQNGSPVEAAETQSCLAGLWQVVKPFILSEVSAEDAAPMQAMFGMSPAQLLDLVKFEATAEFAKISVSLPGDILTKLTQMAAMMMGGGPGGPPAP